MPANQDTQSVGREPGFVRPCEARIRGDICRLRDRPGLQRLPIAVDVLVRDLEIGGHRSAGADIDSHQDGANTFRAKGSVLRFGGTVFIHEGHAGEISII